MDNELRELIKKYQERKTFWEGCKSGDSKAEAGAVMIAEVIQDLENIIKKAEEKDV